MLLHSSFIQFFFHKSLLVQDANMIFFNKIKRLKNAVSDCFKPWENFHQRPTMVGNI